MSGVSVAKKNGGQTSAIFANDTRWRPNSQILHRRDRSNSRVTETARPSGVPPSAARPSGVLTGRGQELVHINGPVQNFGPPARNFGPLRAEFAWQVWRKMRDGHVANWAGLSVFSPQENKISRTFLLTVLINILKYLMHTIPMIVMAYLMVGC